MSWVRKIERILYEDICKLVEISEKCIKILPKNPELALYVTNKMIEIIDKYY